METGQWTDNAIFLMTKFDKQLDDSRTGSKANKFFQEFHDNGIVPHLVITPTLPKEDLPTEELFKQRKELLDGATEKEVQSFCAWLRGHDKFLQTNPDDELLRAATRKRIGFETAKKVMREIMLEDTALRLPEVLTSLRRDLASCQNELKALKEKERFNDPREVKLVVGQVLERVQTRMLAYLDGDLETAVKFPDKLQSLDDELEDEEDSEWCTRELNHYTAEEEKWRERISNLDYPTQIQADKRFLGGKQVQRAMAFFGLVMIGERKWGYIHVSVCIQKKKIILTLHHLYPPDSLPDPFTLKEYVPSGAGYLQGGLQRENWERAITAITKMSVKQISHPGINFLIKHVGHIFRRMFIIALEDVKNGDEFSATFKLMPPPVEAHLTRMFDEMLWELMANAAEKSHLSLEPMYSSIDPTLPTFHPDHIENGDEKGDLFSMNAEGQYAKTPSKSENKESQLFGRFKERMQSFMSLDGNEAKEMLKKESLRKATEKSHFLPDERTAMITEEETDLVIRRAFQYIVALMEFNNILLRFQMNHYLYQGFKDRLNTFTREILVEDWATLVEPDQDVREQIQELEGKIIGLADSLQEVQRIQAKF